GLIQNNFLLAAGKKKNIDFSRNLWLGNYRFRSQKRGGILILIQALTILLTCTKLFSRHSLDSITP
ncbi:MAG: hypothetical protein KKA75_03140, partial [Proteobacteria bacterium]|nr:hypothetical protein [Pseudomonadota bacterium]